MGRKKKLPDGMVRRPGRRGYYADFMVNGRRVQKKLGTEFEAAKSILHELRARAERGGFGLLDNDYPLADLREAYLKACAQELRPASVQRYRERLDVILAGVGVLKVSQLDVTRLVAYREGRLKSVSPGTVNAEVSSLKFMLKWGVDPAFLIGSNPIAGLKPLRHDNPKQGRALTDDEVSRLLEKCMPHWRGIWYAFLVTGMREDELASLRFTDIDWEARELIVRPHVAKGKRERRIPIDDGLLDILKRQASEAAARRPGSTANPRLAEAVARRFSQEHVFVSAGNSTLTGGKVLYRAFMRSCARAGIQVQTYDADGRLVEHVDLHSLRRTFATNAIVNGADPKSVQEILGHKTLEMTMQIYAKVKRASKRQTVARLSYAQGVTPPDHLLQLPPAAGA
jgi:YD repeat-containing protein